MRHSNTPPPTGRCSGGTGLNVGNVWAYHNGISIPGWVISYGESMQVWQISFLSAERNPTILVKANNTSHADAAYVSQLFQAGTGFIRSVVQENNNRYQHQDSQVLTIQPDREKIKHHINTIVIVSNSPSGQIRTYSAAATWRNITISGDESFVRRTLNALGEIEAGPDWAYIYVKTYLNYIVQCDNIRNPRAGGRVNVCTRRFYVYTRTYTSRWNGWYASVIVHEAVHVRQYREHRASSPNRSFATNHSDRVRIEIEAVEYQVRFLDDIGARNTADMARRIIRDIHNGFFWW